MDCIFCQIVAGELAAEFVRESEHSVAFHDLRPQAPLHVLLVPRRHVESPHELGAGDGAAAADLLIGAGEIARERGVAGDGYRLILNCNRHGGQEVPHLHLHLLGGRSLGRMLPG